MKKQTDILRKQYWGINKFYGFDKKEADETISKETKDDDKRPAIKKYNTWNLINDSFYKYHNFKDFDKLSLLNQNIHFQSSFIMV